MRHRDDEQDPPPRQRLRVTIGAAVALLIAAFVAAVLVAAASSGGGSASASGERSGGAAGPRPSAPAAGSGSGAPGGSATPAASLFVHVSGAVRTPGLVTLEPGARVVDAVTAAGGLADDADPDGVNLARLVQDGEQLRVPRVGEVPPPAPPDPAGPAGQAGAVDLNSATQDQLEQLPRIGPALAQRILEWRAANGRFAAVDDLLQVTGIGQKVFDGLKDRVRV